MATGMITNQFYYLKSEFTLLLALYYNSFIQLLISFILVPRKLDPDMVQLLLVNVRDKAKDTDGMFKAVSWALWGRRGQSFTRANRISLWANRLICRLKFAHEILISWVCAIAHWWNFKVFSNFLSTNLVFSLNSYIDPSPEQEDCLLCHLFLYAVVHSILKYPTTSALHVAILFAMSLITE